MKKYAILCMGRSGSSYLYDCLRSTGLCGKPTEHLNHHKLKKSLGDKLYDTSTLHSYLQDIITETSTNNVFGIKINGLNQWKLYSLSNTPIDYWIYLERQNMVLQAVSLYKAKATKVWDIRNKEDDASLKYSFDGILKSYWIIMRTTAVFRNVARKKNALLLSYESDILGNINDCVKKVISFIGENPDDADPIKSNFRIQRNDISYEWERRFRKDSKKIGFDLDNIEN